MVDRARYRRGRNAGGGGPVSAPVFIFGTTKTLDPTGANAAYAQKDTNAICLRNDAMVSDTANGVRYAAWYRNSDGQVVVSKATTPNGDWTATVATAPIIAGATGDSHKAISLVVDSTGRLNGAYGMHSTPDAMNYFRVTNPGDTLVANANMLAKVDGTVGPLVAGKSVIEGGVTYPAYVQLPNGKAHFTWRTGGSGNGDQVLYLVNGTTITSVQDSLIGGSADSSSAYVNTFWVEGSTSAHPGRIWLSWAYRDSANPLTAHDLYCMYSDDEGATWKAADGTVLTIPFRIATGAAALVETIPSGTINFSPQQGMCTNTRGEPIICMYYGTDGYNGGAKLYCWIYRNGAWSRQTMTNYQDATAASRPLVFYHPATNATICMYSMKTNADPVGKWYYTYSTFDDLRGPVTRVVSVLNEVQDVDEAGPLLDSKAYNDGAGALDMFMMRCSVAGTDPSNTPKIFKGTISATAPTYQTPLVTGGAALKYWVDADLANVTNGLVTQLTDKTANGINFTQGTVSKQPLFSASALNGQPSVIADGTDDVLASAIMSRAAPATTNFTIYLVGRSLSWTINDYIWNDCVLGGIIAQVTSTPTIGIYNGTAFKSNGNAPVGSFRFMKFTFTGSVSDSITIGSVTATSTNTGNLSVTNEATTLFSKNDGTAFGNFELCCLFKHEGALSAQQDIDYRAYLGTRYGTTIFT